jgi:exodeoxyribonuclease VII large subunit
MTTDLFGSAAQVLTVTELTRNIRGLLETRFGAVWVQGEIFNYKQHPSGHQYFTLKDPRAQISCVIFRNAMAPLRMPLTDGAQVQVFGNISVFEARGQYQINVQLVQPRGAGLLQAKFDALKRKLEAEGLFEAARKRALPKFPRRIGIITSSSGAAVRDMLNVLRRRAPALHILINPVRVQGTGAAAEIATALHEFSAPNEAWPPLDLVVLTRGGGSMEDLWEFNEEIVARAIFHSAIPVVSAVGHEIDFTICDFVADVRAATPTEAGELVVPDRTEVLASLALYRRRLGLALDRVVARARQRLEALAARYAFRRPETALLERAQRLDDLLERMKTLLDHRLGIMAEALAGSARRLEALSPLKVLGRGYSLTFGPDGRILRSVEGLARGDRILSRLHAGEIESEVTVTRAAPPANVEETTGEE